MTVRTVSNTRRTPQGGDPDHHHANGAGVAESGRRHDDDDESRRLTAHLDVDQSSPICQDLKATIPSIGIVIWVVSLYHLTGEKEVAFDLVNHSAWDAISADGRQTFQTILETETTPLQLLENLQASLARSETTQSGSGEFKAFDGRRHVFMLLDDMSHGSMNGASQQYQVSLLPEQGIFT